MSLFTVLFFLLSISAQANLGQILKLSGKDDSYILRKNNKIKLSANLLLEENDQIHSNSSQVLVVAHPNTQIVLDKNSQLNLSGGLNFIKGKMKARVDQKSKNAVVQKIQANQIAFISSVGDFEVSYGPKQDINLFVANGEVEASSPLVQTFVPEIIKKKEGFKFNIKEPSFSKQPYSSTFKSSFTFKKNL